MNSQMTLFAFAGKCGSFGARGLTERAGPGATVLVSARASMSASASSPHPPPARARNSRREENDSDGGAKKCGKCMAGSRFGKQATSLRRREQVVYRNGAARLSGDHERNQFAGTV